MKSSKVEGKKNMEAEEEEDQEDDDDVGEEFSNKRALTLSGKKVTIVGWGSSSSTQPGCQVEDCGADMRHAKQYHRRHKVCEQHSKARVVNVAGVSKRFCQQCSRFHELSEFDENKRSCRRRLAGHNERRRKSSYDSFGEE